MTIAIESNELQPQGWVKDFGELKPLKDWIANYIDHRDLNIVFGNEGVTSEYLARSFFLWCRTNIKLPLNATLVWAKVSETESSSATYWK